MKAPHALGEVLRGLGYDVDEILPIDEDNELPDGSYPYVAFEWIGARNYLNERSGGKRMPDGSRRRGGLCTSLDFCIRFRRSDGYIQIIAGEWKYTESYENKSIRYNTTKAGETDRLEIYGESLSKPDCQIVGNVPHGALFFDPFYQLMREQLLCSAMEREREMGASVVSLLHIAPHANAELTNRITSKELVGFGTDIHSVWKSLVLEGRFQGVATEDLLPLICANAPKAQTSEYLMTRYGKML